MRHPESGGEVECFLQPVERLIVLPRMKQKLSFERSGKREERVKLAGELHFAEGLLVAAGVRQYMRVKKMPIDLVWVQFDRPTEMSLGAFPVPISPEHRHPERCVALRKSFVQLYSTVRSRSRFCERIRGRYLSTEREPSIRAGDPGVGESVIRIEIDRLLEIGDSLPDLVR